MSGAFWREFALHEQEFADFPFTEVLIFPWVESQFGLAAFADASDGEMRVKIAFFAVTGGLVDRRLQLF